MIMLFVRKRTPTLTKNLTKLHKATEKIYIHPL